MFRLCSRFYKMKTAENLTFILTSIEMCKLGLNCHNTGAVPVKLEPN